MFEVGKVYHRQSEIHDRFGGNRQAGIASSAEHPYVFLFTSPAGKEHGYDDAWISEDIYQYTGEGQIGDMEWSRGNLAIRDHQVNGKQLHLFKKQKSGQYEYLGRFQYQSHELRTGEDSDQNKRSMIVFKLMQI